MTENYEEISDAALTLAPGARAMLAERLLESLRTNNPKNNGLADRVNDSDSSNNAEHPSVKTLTLDLDPDLEQRLRSEANRHGTPPEQYVLRLLEEYVSRTERERREKAIALVQSWIDDGDEKEQKETFEYLVRVLDEDRTSARKLFPEELKGVSW